MQITYVTDNNCVMMEKKKKWGGFKLNKNCIRGNVSFVNYLTNKCRGRMIICKNNVSLQKNFNLIANIIIGRG